MAKTKHFERRMSQRGIRQELVDLVRNFGTPQGDRTRLGRRELDAAIAEIDSLRGRLLRARDKGGIVLVEVGGDLITAYRYEGIRARSARRRPRGF
jgi:hypothetical protein